MAAGKRLRTWACWDGAAWNAAAARASSASRRRSALGRPARMARSRQLPGTDPTGSRAGGSREKRGSACSAASLIANGGSISRITESSTVNPVWPQLRMNSFRTGTQTKWSRSWGVAYISLDKKIQISASGPTRKLQHGQKHPDSSTKNKETYRGTILGR
jgi:hypothetical protein